MHRTLPLPFQIGIFVCLGFWFYFAFWLLRFPPSLSSDDAFYFARGLARFSILDFSPHFPGYPVFIALARLVHLVMPDPTSALIFTTTAITLSLPPLAALIVWRWTAEPGPTFAAFLITLTQPLLAGLALSGLSDGTGLLFFLLFLVILTPPIADNTPNRVLNFARISLARAVVAGIVLGFCAWSRPSYAPLVLAAIFVVIAQQRRIVPALFLGGLLVTVPVLIILFAIEGQGYLHEGLRFFNGHVFIWGNTTLSKGSSDTSWFETLKRYPLLAGLIAIYTFSALSMLVKQTSLVTSSGRTALVAFLVMLFWTGFMQNPENLRHLGPVLFLGGLISSTFSKPKSFWLPLVILTIGINSWLIARTYQFQSALPSPLSFAATFINSELPKGAILLTHHGVAYLRQHLNWVRTYDLFYPQTAAASIASTEELAYRLTSTPLANCVQVQFFPGRVFGEPGLILYSLDQGVSRCEHP